MAAIETQETQETQRVLELNLTSLVDFIGYNVITIVDELEKLIADNYKDNWGYIKFFLWWDCDTVGEYCRGGAYHIKGGPLRDYIDELYHNALKEFANFRPGRDLCEFKDDEPDCALSQYDILELFSLYVKPMLKENERILILYTDEDMFPEVCVILGREGKKGEKDP